MHKDSEGADEDNDEHAKRGKWEDLGDEAVEGLYSKRARRLKKVSEERRAGTLENQKAVELIRMLRAIRKREDRKITLFLGDEVKDK